MTLTKIQNEELDSLKSRIRYIERNIENARANLQMAQDIGNHNQVESIEIGIDEGCAKINKMVSIQAASMKLEYNLVFDLIFDREYTLSIL